MRSCLLVLTSLMVCAFPAFAQEAPPTPDQLLDALYDVWHQQGRQPTPAEIDQQGRYTSPQYLQVWETWEKVRQALAEHLYQKGLFAALQGDRPKAAEHYQQCLEVDPTHASAKEALARLGDLKTTAPPGAAPATPALRNPVLRKAATEQLQFTVAKAGPQAASAYKSFLTHWSRGMEAEAMEQYTLAQRERATYIKTEVERLTNLYTSAVVVFEQGEYPLARQRFNELKRLKAGQIGYEEVYRPHEQDIKRYLASARKLQAQRRTQLLTSRIQNARVAVWMHGLYFPTETKVGAQFFSTRSPIPVTIAHSYRLSSSLGYNVGVATRVVPRLWAGVDWYRVANSKVKYHLLGAETESTLTSGSMQAWSAFLQPGLVVAPYVRVYAQGGVSRYAIDLSQATFILFGLSKALVSVPQKAATGFFAGGGVEFLTFPLPVFTGNLRLDLKYHHVATKIDPATGQQLDLNGLRVGFGIGFMH